MSTGGPRSGVYQERSQAGGQHCRAHTGLTGDTRHRPREPKLDAASGRQLTKLFHRLFTRLLAKLLLH